MRIDVAHLDDGWRPQLDWPEDSLVRMERLADGTCRFEAFLADASIDHVRGEGPDPETAEGAARDRMPPGDMVPTLLGRTRAPVALADVVQIHSGFLFPYPSASEPLRRFHRRLLVRFRSAGLRLPEPVPEADLRSSEAGEWLSIARDTIRTWLRDPANAERWTSSGDDDLLAAILVSDMDDVLVRTVVETPSETTVVADCGGGYCIVEFIDPADARAEARRLEIRQDETVDGRLLFLRDPAGLPVAAVGMVHGIDGPEILDSIRGRGDGRAKTEHLERLRPFVEGLAASSDGLRFRADPDATGMIQSTDGRLHCLRDLPDELEIEDLDISFVQHRPVRLPHRISVSDRCRLYGPGIATAPDELRVGGRLEIERTRIRELPSGLSCASLQLRLNLRLRSLPDGMTIAGMLSARGEPLVRMGSGISIGGDADLAETRIREIPAGTRIGGSLKLQDSAIVSLPDGLVLGAGPEDPDPLPRWLEDTMVPNGSLNIRNTPIAALPRGLVVPGILNAEKSALETLPDDLHVGGDLMLKWSRIRRLPDGLVVRGMLDVGFTRLEALPRGLRVAGDLYISGTGIDEMPDDAEVGGFVFRREWEGRGGPKRRRIDGRWTAVS